MLNRRRFTKAGAAGAAALAMTGRMGQDMRTALAYQSPTSIRKYQQALRGVGPGGIPVAAPDAKPAPVTGATHYTINISQFTDQLHPSLGPTTLRGYNPVVPLGGGTQPQKHLGGIIVAQQGVPVQITFQNLLPPMPILPVDATIMGADPMIGYAYSRVSTHLHGGFVPWISDGGPHATWDPNGNRGDSFVDLLRLLNPKTALKPNQAEYFYPNLQTARMLWYHDHAIGITRLNAYSGIATAYILRDAFEGNLRNMGLPDFVENGGREIPIVIQDKIFVGAGIATVDPAWVALGLPSSVGSLWYPHAYDGDLGPRGTPPPLSCVPEMFGDTMLANGLAYPWAKVQARRYRLRVLNACQSRFLNLQLYVDNGSPAGITLKNGVPTNAKGPDLLVLGTEGGFLSRPVLVPSNQPFNARSLTGSLITAPAERWDVLVDFSGYAGQKLILYNDAPAPFPSGDPGNDYVNGADAAPDTRQIMRFDVVPAVGAADRPLTITTGTDLTPGIDKSLVGVWTTAPLPPPPGVPVRQLTLNEDFDKYGRLVQMLGTNTSTGKTADGSSLYFGRPYDGAATEQPSAGATEVWQIANLTGDTHPIHFHLVNVQILSRQPFNAKTYAGTPSYTGPARGPEPTELGWKETVKMHPGEVTSVIMRFDLPTVPFTVPASPRTGGNEYVWHCHILEHEEHDMMRPLVVM